MLLTELCKVDANPRTVSDWHRDDEIRIRCGRWLTRAVEFPITQRQGANPREVRDHRVEGLEDLEDLADAQKSKKRKSLPGGFPCPRVEHLGRAARMELAGVPSSVLIYLPVCRVCEFRDYYLVLLSQNAS